MIPIFNLINLVPKKLMVTGGIILAGIISYYGVYAYGKSVGKHSTQLRYERQVQEIVKEKTEQLSKELTAALEQQNKGKVQANILTQNVEKQEEEINTLREQLDVIRNTKTEDQYCIISSESSSSEEAAVRVDTNTIPDAYYKLFQNIYNAD